MTQTPITTIYDDEGMPTELPTSWQICDDCHGEGHHTNPAIDGNGLDPHDPDLDEDFWDGYWSGRYDITCDACGGSGKVKAVDTDKCTAEQISALAEAYVDRYQTEAIMRMERMMGA